MDYIETFRKTYWEYYLTIENRLLKTAQYVAFDEVNKNAYSIEYLMLYQTICSELDVLGKEISRKFNPSFDLGDQPSITKWGYSIQQVFPDLENKEVLFNGQGIKPFEHWQSEQYTDKKGSVRYRLAPGKKSLFWWKEYTDVKHARTDLEDGRQNYQKANQRNVIFSLAALYLLERLVMIKLDSTIYGIMERSKLFRIPDRFDEETVHFAYNEQGQPCQIVDA